MRPDSLRRLALYASVTYLLWAWGGAVSSPSGVFGGARRKLNLVHFSLKI